LLLPNEKSAFELRHQGCGSAANMGKQREERDTARIQELLDEKEERDGQLKKT
jgi:hypothetical protein